MAKVITLSRKFLKGHIREGQSTLFVEKVWASLTQTMGYSSPEFFFDELLYLQNFISLNEYVLADPKHHTIRAGNRFKDGDMASLRVWSGKPYNSPQIAIAPEMKVKVKSFEIDKFGFVYIDGKPYKEKALTCSLIEGCDVLAKNDGLTAEDISSWFNKRPFSGQMIIWSNVELPY